MADGNITVDNGAGTDYVPATDRVASVDYQLVKLVNSTEDSVTRTGIAGDPLVVSGAVTATVATHDVGSITTAIVPGTAATNLGKAEDAVHASGDTGVMALAVRTDTAAARATTDGDYAPLEVDSTGRLHVNVGNTVAVSGTVTVTGVATETTLASLLTSSQLIDDSITTTGSAVTAKGVLATGTDGTNARALKTDSSGELQVDVLTLPAVTGTVTVTGVATEATLAALSKAEDAVHASGDQGIQALTVRSDTAAAKGGTDGDYQPLVTDASGRLHVNVGNTVGVSGTVAVTNSDLTSLGTLVKTEDGAHVTADKGIMALSVRQDSATQLAGTDGDYSPLSTDGNGYLWSRVGFALPAGTNAIGKLAANSGVDIGDVDVTTVVPGVAATSLGKAEDAAHVTGDTGVAVLAVRRDAAAVGSGTDGDYSTLNVDANGSLYVTGAGGGTQYNIDSVASATATGTVALVVRKDSGASLAGTDGDITGLQVDASGSLRVTGGGGGTEYTEDVASPADPVGNAQMLVRDDATGSIVTTEGDWIAARANVNGAQWMIHDGAIAVTDNAGSLTVDGTVAVTNADLTTLGALSRAEDAAHSSGHTGIMALAVRQDTAAALATTDGDYIPLIVDASGRQHVNVGASALPTGAATETTLATVAALSRAEDAAHASGHTGVMGLSVRQDTAAALAGTDADYQPLITDSTGRLHVNVGNTVTVGSHAVTNAGTFATQVDGAALTALQLIDNIVLLEDVAHASGDPGVFALAVRHDTATTGLGADGDYAALSVGSDGRLQVNVGNSVTVATHDVGSITTAIVPGTAATNLGKAEDAAHASGDTGVFALAVRNDTSTTGLGATGDYAAISVDALGGVWTAGTLVDDAAFTPGTNRVLATGLLADESSTDSVDEGDIGIPRITLDRKQIVTNQPHTAGGCLVAMDIDLDETELEIKGSAGQLYGWYVYNDGAAEVYVKIYNNTAAGTTVGTTVPVMTMGIPAGGAANVFLDTGIAFSTGICAAATTICTTADATAPAANQVVSTFFYL